MKRAVSVQQNSSPLSPIESSVVNTLLYFDLFHHPLNTDEIHRNCQWERCSLSEVALALEQLQGKGIIDESGGFWYIQGNHHLVRIREERSLRAVQFLKKVKRYSRFISSFPFVRAVFISGSLSKGTMDKDGDIDYFIITEPGRLWLARTLLVLFKKIFLFNSKKYFCVNYFIDTENLDIPDRNLFVATELVHLLPMRGGTVCHDFLKMNKWAELFYPNRKMADGTEVPDNNQTWVKGMLESLFSGRFGSKLDDRMWRITLKRWKRKFPSVDPIEFENKFRSRKNTSKHHPNGFQQRVARALEDHRKQVSLNSGIHIPALPWEWFHVMENEKQS